MLLVNNNTLADSSTTCVCPLYKPSRMKINVPSRCANAKSDPFSKGAVVQHRLWHIVGFVRKDNNYPLAIYASATKLQPNCSINAFTTEFHRNYWCPHILLINVAFQTSSGFTYKEQAKGNRTVTTQACVILYSRHTRGSYIEHGMV